jgi:hypothetical protein
LPRGLRVAYRRLLFPDDVSVGEIIDGGTWPVLDGAGRFPLIDPVEIIDGGRW